MRHQSAGFAFRRVMANGIDLFVGLALGLALSSTAIGIFFASRAVVMLRIGVPDTIWKGPIPMILGILGPFVYGLPFAILIVLLAEPLVGTSPGKALLGLAIRPCGAGMLTGRQYWHRAIVKAAPFWGLTIALLAGSWVLALVFSIAGVALLVDVSLSLFAPLRPVHEIMSGSCLARRGVVTV